MFLKNACILCILHGVLNCLHWYESLRRFWNHSFTKKKCLIFIHLLRHAFFSNGHLYSIFIYFIDAMAKRRRCIAKSTWSSRPKKERKKEKNDPEASNEKADINTRLRWQRRDCHYVERDWVVLIKLSLFSPKCDFHLAKVMWYSEVNEIWPLRWDVIQLARKKKW